MAADFGHCRYFRQRPERTAEAIAGLQHTESGSDVKFFAPGEEDKPMELLGKSPKDIRDAGVHLSFVPEDRLGMAWLAPWA